MSSHCRHRIDNGTGTNICMPPPAIGTCSLLLRVSKRAHTALPQRMMAGSEPRWQAAGMAPSGARKRRPLGAMYHGKKSSLERCQTTSRHNACSHCTKDLENHRSPEALADPTPCIASHCTPALAVPPTCGASCWLVKHPDAALSNPDSAPSDPGNGWSKPNAAWSSFFTLH